MMVRVVLLVTFALLDTIFAIPPKQEEKNGLPFSLVADNGQNANASLVENFLDSSGLDTPAGLDSMRIGKSPNQWPVPEVFRRQAVCSNYCGPTQSAPRSYCGCGSQCCGTGCCATASGQVCCAAGGCCNTATGAVCCGASCCINGATCNGNQVCALRTTVVSVVATATSYLYRDISFTVTAVGGTVTITSTFSSVTVVTISTADIATSVTTATVTMAAGKRARDLRPADVAEQPLETSTLDLHSYRKELRREQNVQVPQTTQFSPPPHSLEKRQNNLFTTVTSIISTITVPYTSTRLVTTTISARATATYSTTTWQTVTSVINAKKTTTSTSTVTYTPGMTPPNSGPTTTPAPGGGGGGGGGPNDPPDQVSTNKGLSKGAQAGIGAGTAGGSLIICIILGFWFWRRRKTRAERNQEMIDNAVTSAMAAQRTQSPQQQQYYDGKHLSTTTTSIASPHPYSPTPPLHSPQPTYVYPPPAGHGQQQQPMYQNSGPMGFQESGMDPQNQYRYSAPAYGGSEIDGSPIQRHELQQFSSPPPAHVAPYGDVPHPGVYAEQGSHNRDRGRDERGFSDLPEVRPSDLPELRR